MTNNPKKIVGLQGYGLEIVERVPIQVYPNPTNEKYLKTKREKLGHLLQSDQKQNP
jgi:3,4-dihydroxy 2-butanone 4-phosphate synthase/GTP cyclohydrolase II